MSMTDRPLTPAVFGPCRLLRSGLCVFAVVASSCPPDRRGFRNSPRFLCLQTLLGKPDGFTSFTRSKTSESKRERKKKNQRQPVVFLASGLHTPRVSGELRWGRENIIPVYLLFECLWITWICFLFNLFVVFFFCLFCFCFGPLAARRGCS